MSSPHSRRYFYLALLGITLFRLWLLGAQEPYLIAPAGHDDGLFMRGAENVLAGRWLGTYDNLTLIKGPGFPLFLALNALLSLPLLFTQALLYLSGGIIFASALRRCGLPALLVVLWFALFALNPALSSQASLRVIRDSFYTGTVVWLAAAALQYLIAETKVAQIGWIKGCAVLTAVLFITREEGIWLVPGALVLLLGLALQRRAVTATLRSSLFLRSLPFGAAIVASVIGAELVIRGINQHYYGVAVRSELRADYFMVAYGSLARIQAGEPRAFVPVPRAAREAAYSVSPAFAELRPALESGRWIGSGCMYISPCDDLASHFLWALRDAVARAGYYSSAIAARDYYLRLADEINGACNRGALTCSPLRASLSPPLSSVSFSALLERYLRAFNFVISFDDTAPEFRRSLDNSVEQLRSSAKLIHHPELTILPIETIAGWVVDKTDAPIALTVRREDDSLQSSTVRLEESVDVAAHFAQSGTALVNAAKARFRFEIRCAQSCLLEVQRGGEVVHSYDFISGATVKSDPQIVLHIDHGIAPAASISSTNDARARILVGIHAAFQSIIVPLSIAALGALLWAMGVALYRRVFPAPLLIAVVTVTLIATRLALLAFIDLTSFHAINNIYNLPSFALLLMAIGAAGAAVFARR